MSAQPVPAWNSNVAVGSEATFATPVDPVLAQNLEVISFNTGPIEQGNVRPKRDRGPGRGMQTAFIEGRVEPIAWSMEMSQKSRAAIDTAAVELAIFKAAGLKQTISGSTSTAFSLVADPLATADFASATMRRVLGHSANSNAGLAQTLFGSFVEQLTWAGGDKELTLSASGKAAGSRATGAIDSITFASGVDTAITVTAAETYRMQVGEYFMCETEIVKVTAVTHGSTTVTFARAQLSTSGAAHAAKPLYPYFPVVSALAGRPLTEAVCTVSLGGITTRATAFSIDMKTGISALPGETGSTRIQGVKMGRYDFSGKVSVLLKGDDVTLLGRMNDRSTAAAQAITIVQGTGTGGIATFSLPYCEFLPSTVPDTFNDGAMVEIGFRVRENSGSDAFTMTLT